MQRASMELATDSNDGMQVVQSIASKQTRDPYTKRSLLEKALPLDGPLWEGAVFE